MASGRSRRANAGAKMATLIDSMENDDEESADQSPTEDHDEVDSDSSIDEDEEGEEKKEILKQFSKLSLKELQVCNVINKIQVQMLI